MPGMGTMSICLRPCIRD